MNRLKGAVPRTKKALEMVTSAAMVWGKLIRDVPIATGLPDRILHRVEIIQINLKTVD